MQKAAGVIILILLTIASSISYALRVEKVRTFSDWDVVIANRKESCLNNLYFAYAVSVPKRSVSFKDGIATHGAAYTVVSCVMRGAWTFSIKTNLSQSREMRFVLTAGGRAYTLSDAHGMLALTTSSSQDVSIINNLIDHSDYFEVHALFNDEHVAVDTYSLDGFINALQYIEQNFANISCAN